MTAHHEYTVIEDGTALVGKFYWPEGTKTVVFLMDVERHTRKKLTRAEEKAFVENVSIHSLKARVFELHLNLIYEMTI